LGVVVVYPSLRCLGLLPELRHSWKAVHDDRVWLTMRER
jgi:hypothetical protein